MGSEMCIRDSDDSDDSACDAIAKCLRMSKIIEYILQMVEIEVAQPVLQNGKHMDMVKVEGW